MLWKQQLLFGDLGFTFCISLRRKKTSISLLVLYLECVFLFSFLNTAYYCMPYVTVKFSDIQLVHLINFQIIVKRDSYALSQNSVFDEGEERKVEGRGRGDFLKGERNGLRRFGGIRCPSKPQILNPPNWGNFEGEGFHLY